MSQRPRPPLALLGTALALASLSLPCSAHPAGEDTAPHAAFEAPAPELAAIAAALRLARLPIAPPREQLLGQLLKAGEGSLAPLLDVLILERVPAVKAEDAPQILSRAQRELLLAALGRLPLDTVRRALERRTVDSEDPQVWRAWLRMLAALGNDQDLERVLRRWKTSAGQPPPTLERNEWRAAFVAFLRRSPARFELAEISWRGLLPEQARGLIEACGEVAHPRAQRLLTDVIGGQTDDLALTAIGQVRRVGRGYDPQVERELCEALRSWLDPRDANTCQNALQALGELRDPQALELCLEWLEHEDPNIQLSARWALERASDLQLPEPGSWRRWFQEQQSALAQARRTLPTRLLAEDLAVQVEALRQARELKLERAEVAAWIVPLLEQPHTGLRTLACEILADLDERSSVPALVELLADGDAKVRAAAEKALAKLSERPLGGELEAWRAELAVLRRAG